MGLTRFPNGIFATPVVGGGSGRFDGMWGKTYFVDYDHGSDEGDGLSPDTAKKHLQDCIDLATINDVIYIRNRDEDVTTTDPEFILPESTTNWSIAQAKTHLSIIGAGNSSHVRGEAGRFGVYLRGNATTTTGPVMDWMGAGGLIENITFHRGATTSGGLLKLTGNSTSLRSAFTTVSNCGFRLSNHAVGALYNVDNWWVRIEDCMFHDCKVGVHCHGSSSTMKRQEIVRCLFRNQTAASVDMNIYIQGSSSGDINILDCDFSGAAPTGGTNMFIQISAAATGIIAGCRFSQDVTLGSTLVTNNSIPVVDCYDTGTGTGGQIHS